MSALTTEALIDMALPVIFYFIVGSLGSFTKDMYETMTGKIEKIRMGEILVSGVVTTIICYGLSDTWFKDFSLNTMFIVTFIIGVLGFELFGNMTTISNIRNLFLIVDEIRKGVPPDSSGNGPTNTRAPDSNNRRDEGSIDDRNDEGGPRRM